MATAKATASLRHGRPIWLREESDVRFAPLKGLHSCDVVIVGGGITGVLVAVMFASAGISVCLLEEHTVGGGSTVASSALLLQEPDQGIRELARRYGRASAARIWRLSHDAVRDFIQLLDDLRIDCDRVERDAVYYARTADAAWRLRDEFIARGRAGFGGEWVGPRALRETIGITGFGAIRTKGSAQFDPWKACRGLLNAAVDSGARVFERTPVTRIERRRRRVRVHSHRGRVDARQVIVATGY